MDTINLVNACHVPYFMLGPNRNAFVYNALKRAGLPTLSGARIRRIIGNDALMDVDWICRASLKNDRSVVNESSVK